MSEPKTTNDRYREYDEKVAAQTEALASLGFGPAFDIDGGLFSVAQAATCQTCGSMVRTDAVAVHHDWHETPDPRQAP